MKRWLHAFRLRTLPLSLSSIVLGSFLAYFSGRFEWVIAILAGVTTIFLQILSNLANDYGDAKSGVDNEDRVGPDRAIQSGRISASLMFRAIIIFVVLSLASGIWLIYEGTKDLELSNGLAFLALGVLAILAAIKYTMGKNPYGYLGLGDLFVFLFFGVTGVAGTFFLHTNQFHWSVLLPAASVGLLSTAVLNLNNMRDRENDRASGKNTLVVKLGLERAKTYHSFLIGTAVATAVIFSIANYVSPFQFIYLIVLPILILNLRVVWKHQNPSTLDPELKKIALGTLLFSITFGLGLLIEHA